MMILLLIIILCFEQFNRNDSKSVLITGGCGFVGRHFTKKYCDLKWNVTIVDNMISDSAIEINKWPEHLSNENCSISFHRMDCREYFASSISRYNFNVFIHLAAIIGGRAMIEGNPLAVAEDLAIDSAAFKYAVDETSKPERMIYFSSSAAYPVRYQDINDKNVLNEDMINLTTQDIGIPDLTYGWSKLTGEYLAQIASKQYGLNVSVYRPMSGYGEDQHTSYPFNSILKQILKKEDPISIWSDSVRDFVHVDDIVDCVVDSMDQLNAYEAINIGSGIATSFTQLAREMAFLVGYTPNINVLEGKPSGPMHRVGDVSKFKSVGCSNKISLQQGILRAIEYSMTRPPMEEVAKSAVQYSSMQCTAGAQNIPCSSLQKTPETFPYANSYKRRVCKFENVCRINGTFTYFANRDSAVPLTSFNDGKLLRLGYKSYDWAPHVVFDTIPTNIPYSKTTYNLLYETSYSDNFGHFLIDDMLPQLFALNMWNIPVNDVTFVVSKYCELKGITSKGLVDIESPLNPNMTRNEACINKYNTIYKYIFDAPMQTNDIEDICYQKLIAGQSHTFSLNSLTLGRSGLLRQLRDLVVDRSGLSHLLIKKNDNHKILVLTKDRGWTNPDKFLQVNLCNTVKRFSVTLVPSVEVHCFANVSDLTFQNQLKMTLESTLIITEHGTLSYASLFVRDGLVSIVLAAEANDTFKEPQILLHMTHCQVYYLNTEKIETDLYPMILLGLNQVSKNLGIQMPTYSEKSTVNNNGTTIGIKTKVSTAEPLIVQYLQVDGSTVEEIINVSEETDPFELAFDYCARKRFNKIECKDIYNRIVHLHRKLNDVCE